LVREATSRWVRSLVHRLRCESQGAEVNEFVNELRHEDAADLVARLGGGGAQHDEEVGLTGAAVPHPTTSLAVGDPAAAGEGVDRRWVGHGVRGEVNSARDLGWGNLASRMRSALRLRGLRTR
jgi:hypothetical protein